MEKTGEIYISNRDQNYAEALDKADEFIKAQDIDRKKAIRLRLIVEETIGMIRAMTGVFNAKFWLEHNDSEYRLVLTGKTEMDKMKKDDLLSVASSGKNAAAKGFMGKIGDMLENGMLNFDDVMDLQQEYVGTPVNYAMIGYSMPEDVPVMGDAISWSLGAYKQGLESNAPDNETTVQAWDELEKSIVASIAKDVTVGIKKDRVDMTIVMDA